jgi:twinkle protein
MTAKLLDRLKPSHLEMLEARGLEGETLARHGVVSCGRADGEWVAIPYLRDGQVVNHKYRTIAGEKRFYQDAGAAKQFWNIDVLRDASLSDLPVIITEGEFDALVALQCGFGRVMSVPDGAPAEAIGENQESVKYTFVEDAKKQLSDVKEIILATDSDGPGVNLMNDLALRLGKARCRFVRYPTGCKDLNDAFKAYGPKGVAASLTRAEWCRVDGLYRMSELPPVAEIPVYRLGMPVMDDHYRIRPTDFCVVTGIPSHGKTSWLNEVACRMSRRHGWTTAFASFEQHPQRDQRRNLRTYFHSKRVIHQTEEERAEADHWIEQSFSFLVPSDEDEISLEWVIDKARAAVVQHGAKLVVIDPWNEMDHVRPRDWTMTEYTGYAIKEFKRFARRFNVHLIVAAHPAKQRREEGGAFAIPHLYDIADSAHWYNKPDVGMVVWRGPGGKNVIRIAKSRYHDQIGVPGDVEVLFDPESNHYRDLEPEMIGSSAA